MPPRRIKILLPLFWIQIIFGLVAQAQIRNGAFQNLPAQDFSTNGNNLPAGNNFPAFNGIPFINSLALNDNAANNLKMLPKMPFFNGKISDLANLASSFNSGLLTGNNSPFNQNSFLNNNLKSSNNFPGNNLLLNNKFPASNNLPNNAPNNNFAPPVNNLPHNCQIGHNNAVNANNLHNIENINIPANNPSKVNSLTLSGPAFNSGQPFNVLPANNAFNNEFQNNFIYNDAQNNGLKIARSLPSNEMSDGGYQSKNFIQNNAVNERQFYGNDVQNSNIMANNMPQNNYVSNGFQKNNAMQQNNNINNGVPTKQPVASNYPTNVPAGYPVNEGYSIAGMLSNNEEFFNSYSPGNVNNQPHRENYDSNNYPMHSNGWQQPINNNIQYNYQTNDMASISNTPVNSAGCGQPTGNILNLPVNAGVSQPPVHVLNQQDINLQVSAGYGQSSGNVYSMQDTNVAVNAGYGQPSGNVYSMQDTNVAVNAGYGQPSGNVYSMQDTNLPVSICSGQSNGNILNLPVGSNYGQPTGNIFNLPDLASNNVNMLNLGEYGSLPIYSGFPVIGITETISVIDPEQFYQNQLVY